MEDKDATLSPPPNIGETIESIARLHTEHRAAATRHQRAVERITSWLGRPSAVIGLTFFVIVWIGGNSLAAGLGHGALDSFPFPVLTSAASLASLYLVILILTTQRRDDHLAGRRELLAPRLAILSEQKTAKAIALLEEFRRDSPQVHDRVDDLAEAMAQPADPQSVIDAIQQTHSEATRASGPTPAPPKTALRPPGLNEG